MYNETFYFSVNMGGNISRKNLVQFKEIQGYISQNCYLHKTLPVLIIKAKSM